MLEVKRLLKDGDILFLGSERYNVCSILNQNLKEGVLTAHVVVNGNKEIRFSSADEGANIFYSRKVDYTKSVEDYADIDKIVKEVYQLFNVGSGADYFFGDIITFRLVEGGVEVTLECGIVPVRSSFGFKASVVVGDEVDILSKETIDKLSYWIVVGNLERVEIHLGNGYSEKEYVERESSIVSGTDDTTMEYQTFLMIGRRRLLGRSILLDNIKSPTKINRESFLYYNLILKGFLESLSYYREGNNLIEDFYSPYGYTSRFVVVSNIGEEETYELRLSTKNGEDMVSVFSSFDKDFKCTDFFQEGFNGLGKDDLESCFIRILEWFDKLPFSVSRFLIELNKGYSRGDFSAVCRGSEFEWGSVDVSIFM